MKRIDTDLFQEMAERMQHEIRRQKITLRTISEETGISLTQIQKHVNGVTPMPLLAFIRVCRYLEADLPYMLACDCVIGIDYAELSDFTNVTVL